MQYFAALGYAVLQINYRGSIGYGQDFIQRDIFEVCDKSVADVADGLKWAVEQGYADPKRLVVCGNSFGGYIAVALAARYPDLPACVAAFAGVYDWNYQHRYASNERPELFAWISNYYPEAKDNAERYRAVSPVHQAAAINAPVLLIHGRQDKVVDIGQSEVMARALRKAGKPVEILKDAEGGHGLTDFSLRKKYYERLTSFFQQYAPSDPATAP